MGRKSARKSPLQESLLQKQRFGGILVIARAQEIPASADMQPASPGGLFIFGLLYSVIGGGAGRFWPRNVNRAGIPRISRAGIFEGFHTFVCCDATRGRLGETWRGCGPMTRLSDGCASNSAGCGWSGRGVSQAPAHNARRSGRERSEECGFFYFVEGELLGRRDLGRRGSAQRRINSRTAHGGSVSPASQRRTFRDPETCSARASASPVRQRRCRRARNSCAGVMLGLSLWRLRCGLPRSGR